MITVQRPIQNWVYFDRCWYYFGCGHLIGVRVWNLRLTLQLMKFDIKSLCLWLFHFGDVSTVHAVLMKFRLRLIVRIIIIICQDEKIWLIACVVLLLTRFLLILISLVWDPSFIFMLVIVVLLGNSDATTYLTLWLKSFWHCFSSSDILSIKKTQTRLLWDVVASAHLKLGQLIQVRSPQLFGRVRINIVLLCILWLKMHHLLLFLFLFGEVFGRKDSF